MDETKGIENEPTCWWHAGEVPQGANEVRQIADLFEARKVDKELVKMLRRIADRWERDEEGWHETVDELTGEIAELQGRLIGP